MAADRRWRLVSYDVRDPKRWRKVYKLVLGRGSRVQYSVFRCRLDDREAERLRWELARVMAKEDSLLIVDLCPRCARTVVARNHVDDWSADPASFQILLPAEPDQGSVDVRGAEGDLAEDGEAIR